jgi:hypothetical protein
MVPEMLVDISYAAPYSSGIVFIFSQGRNDLYHV